MKKITLLICLVIILNVPISAYAQATSTTTTVTIAAGSGAAVGGVFNQNGSKTAMMATALTLAVLSATGAAVKLTEDSVAAGKTVYQVINDKFAQWVGGTSAEELTPTQAEELQSRFKVITGGGGNEEDPDNNQNNGTNIDQDGKLWFSPGSLAMLKKFTDFLESSNSINDLQGTNNDPLDFGPYSTVMSRAVGIGDSATDFYHISIVSNIEVAVFVDDASFYSDNMHRYCFAISDEPFICSGGSSNGSSISYRGYYYFTASNFGRPGRDYTPAGVLNTVLTATEVIDRIIQWHETAANVEEDGIYKGENYNSDILQNPNNQSLVVDPGILSNITPASDQQISIPDYLQLLLDQAQANATAQNQPLSVPAIDPATLEVSPLEVPVIEQDPISDPVPSEEADPIETPDNPVQDPDEVPTPEDAVELLKVDLTKIFPFCIPWDIYRILAKFNADPVTPSITIDWGNILGSVGVDFETTLDLHDFDSVASVLRTMETVAFVVGLAVATRSIFLRS